MKSLFEIATSHCGESYVRSYAWAHCEEDAREMFSRIFPTDKQGQSYEIVEVKRLFHAEAAEFITPPSDAGFETEGVVEISDLRQLASVKMRDILNRSN